MELQFPPSRCMFIKVAVQISEKQYPLPAY
jgi:hypothetical protein